MMMKKKMKNIFSKNPETNHKTEYYGFFNFVEKGARIKFEAKKALI